MEVAKITRGDLSKPGQTQHPAIRVHREKKRKRRTQAPRVVVDVWLPIPLDVHQRLTTRIQKQPFKQYLLMSDPRPRGDRETPEQYQDWLQRSFFHNQQRALSRRISRCLRRVGLHGFSHHSMRRTLITWLTDSNVGDRKIMSVTGHTSTRMLETYTQRRDQRRRVVQTVAETLWQHALKEAAGK